MLLPFLEQNAIYNAANFMFINQGNGIAESYGNCWVNTTAVTTKVNSFVCPSNPAIPGTFYNARPRVGNSYFGNQGATIAHEGGWTNGQPNGVLFYRGVISERDILDGTSNTVMWGEWRMGDFSQQKLTFDDVINVGNVFPDGRTNNADTINSHAPGISISGFLASYIATCRAGAGTGSVNAPSNNNRSWIGEQWATGMPGRSLGNMLFPPNTKEYNCMSCQGCGDFDGAGIFKLASYHPGGCNIGMADGSVRYLKDSTNVNTVWALGTRAQGEALSADQY